MQKNDAIYGHSLMFVIVNKGKGSEVLNYALELGIRGATAFRARGIVPNRILKLLELEDVHKEIIIIAMPTRYENDMLDKLTARFGFDRANKGIIFTLSLSGIYGSSHFDQQLSQTTELGEKSPLQAVMTVVDKSHTDRILDYVEEHGFPWVTVIDAHGSADKSNTFLNLMLESEKSILLIMTTPNQAHRLASLLTEYLNLESSNSGILSILNLRKSVGITLPSQTELSENKSIIKENNPGYSAIFAIVENNRDEAVIKSAELAGSTGGTIIHARGSCSYHGKNFFSRGIEPEREIVMIIAEDDKIQAICHRINADLQLDQPGKGILLVVPLYDTVGLVPSGMLKDNLDK